jgi:hypothetical protein
MLRPDGGGFDHFDHEGGAAPCEVVRGSDPAEKLGDEADAGCGGWDVGPGLREKGDEGVLAKEGGFPRHVRAGEEPDGGGVLVGEEAVIGDERLAFTAKGPLHNGVATASDLEGAAVVDLGAAPVFLGGEVGEGGGEVDLGERAGGQRNGRGVVEKPGLEVGVVALFDFERVVGGV